MDNKEMQEFNIGQYVATKDHVKKSGRSTINDQKENLLRFGQICDLVRNAIDEIEEAETQKEIASERQKNAMLGMPDEIEYYKVNIREIIRSQKIQERWFPSWYQDFEEAIFQEIYGFAGLHEWIRATREDLTESSSAKIIGDRIFFRINGRPVLQPQKISKDRRDQLKKSLLLSDPRKPKSDEQHEVYLFSDSIERIRVKIASDKVTKKTQDTFTFRKYIVNDYTFETQVERHTIPDNAVPLFLSMIKIGFNVMFVGPPGCGKSTIFTTWEKYEDDCLEGVQIENDPETPWHILKPDAPITQYVPNEKNYRTIMKEVLRDDPDYVMIGEAREPIALYIAVDAANRGTSRVKLTYHTTDMIDICHDIAKRIVGEFGGDLASTIISVAKSFHYIFQMETLPDKSQKRLSAIWEVRYNPLDTKISMHNIMKRRIEEDDWVWSYHLGEDKAVIGQKSAPEALQVFKMELKKLSEESPMPGASVFTPSYDHLFGREGK